ncbi:MAG TPA: hypothetical protein PLW02_01325 [Verrucomicrobiota bacterium]|nr:hypothetical protein [Verrucomicrobiota bacterium]
MIIKRNNEPKSISIFEKQRQFITTSKLWQLQRSTGIPACVEFGVIILSDSLNTWEQDAPPTLIFLSLILIQ